MTGEAPTHPRLQEHRHANDREMLARLALASGDIIAHALSERGTACIAVSGGRSPVALFEVLRERDLDWSRVIVTLVDERCVPQDHADSNARLVRQHLLTGRAAQARFVPLIDGLSNDTLPGSPALDSELLALTANQRLADLPRLDLAILGMGDDGHTASWFAGATGLAQAIAVTADVATLSSRMPALDCRVVVPATAPHARLTLTLPAVLASRHIALQFSGATKAAIYHHALQSASLQYPVSLLLHQTAAPVDVWIAH